MIVLSLNLIQASIPVVLAVLFPKDKYILSINLTNVWQMYLMWHLHFSTRWQYVYFFSFFIIQRVKARAIPCPHQSPTRGDNTVLVAQGGTATTGATKQLLPPDRVFKRIIYIYIYARSIKSRDCIGCSSSFLVQFVIFKKCIYFRPLVLLHVYSSRFLMLHNHTGMVVPRVFHSCWKLEC